MSEQSIDTINQKIAIYLPSLQGGGAERSILNLANGMVERGLSVDLVLAIAEGPFLKEVHPKLRVVNLRSRRVLFSIGPLVRYLRTHRPVVMLAAMNYANVAALLAGFLARTRTRIVVSERVIFSKTSFSERWIRWKENFLHYLMAWTYPRAAGIIAVSEDVAEDLSRTLGLARDQIAVVYNPIVSDQIKTLMQAPIPHPWLNSDQIPVILGVGRLVEQKDFKTLIRAFALVRAVRPMRLVILGEGQSRPELEALAMHLGLSSDLLLPGFMDNPFVWMRHAKVFVLSSLYEGLPGVLIQAMACGVPVVSTDCPGGTREILDNGRFGKLVPIGKEREMAGAILTVVGATHLPNAVERAADFSVEQAVSGYLSVMGIEQGV